MLLPKLVMTLTMRGGLHSMRSRRSMRRTRRLSLGRLTLIAAHESSRSQANDRTLLLTVGI